MVFKLEIRFTTVCLVVFHAFLASQKNIAVLKRLHMEFLELLTCGRAVTAEREHINAKVSRQINKLRQFMSIHA